MSGGLVFFEEFCARDVRRHEVGRKLDAAEGQVEGACEGADEERFGQAGHADEQTMAPAEEGDEELIDDFPLAYNDFANFGDDLVISGF